MILSIRTHHSSLPHKTLVDHHQCNTMDFVPPKGCGNDAQDLLVSYPGIFQKNASTSHPPTLYKEFRF